ncbi:MAG: restriction endonuclease [bacterium]|nr:restriction endonuclease [bacterium]
MDNTHIAFQLPKHWSNDRKGQFFESFVANLLRPMRYEIIQRVRFTGSEIDILAKGLDQPLKILVECKAQKEPVRAEVLSKLFGEVGFQKADAGWLFSTSDLGKEARGKWEEIKEDPELSRKLVWYPPSRLADILVAQNSIKPPLHAFEKLPSLEVGHLTLVIGEGRLSWLVELIENGLPTYFAVLDARTNDDLTSSEAIEVAGVNPRFSSLRPLTLPASTAPARTESQYRAPVARVISGEAWDDLRPSRPQDFVGRDEVIQQIGEFIAQVRERRTGTRTLAIEGPSGWGKSSLVLKLADLARRRKLSACSITAVDTRSAVNSSFVCEAVRTAFLDAAKAGYLPGKFASLKINSLTHPFESPDVEAALEHLTSTGSVIALIFDQFEELFAKEALFDTFHAVRELCLEADAREIPFVLGFAWKTDISLPQQHPAYHLWHELCDRRRSFPIREFGTRDIARIISRVERVQQQKLSLAVRARLIEQCQGLPWLMKKLLVHLFRRVGRGPESQFHLLERELDVNLLFKEDLAAVSEQQLRCLKYVAANAPVAVPEVEEAFGRDVTNSLIGRHLLVRSGMNYVVYWDIFRDYLLDPQRVPQIPWARTFQSETNRALKAFAKLQSNPRVTSSTLGLLLGWNEKYCVNVLSDLVALQVVDRLPGDLYCCAEHLTDMTPKGIGRHVMGQLRRHVVYGRFIAEVERGRALSVPDWEQMFRRGDPRSATFSQRTVSVYSGNLRRWLLFAGLLEEVNGVLHRPSGEGSQLGLLLANRTSGGIVPGVPALFLAASRPGLLVSLLLQAAIQNGQLEGDIGERKGLRNVVADARALGVLKRNRDKYIVLEPYCYGQSAIAELKQCVLRQPACAVTVELLRQGKRDLAFIGGELKGHFHTKWKDQSARRYAGGLVRFCEWASGTETQQLSLVDWI